MRVAPDLVWQGLGDSGTQHRNARGELGNHYLHPNSRLLILLPLSSLHKVGSHSGQDPWSLTHRHQPPAELESAPDPSQVFPPCRWGLRPSESPGDTLVPNLQEPGLGRAYLEVRI